MTHTPEKTWRRRVLIAYLILAVGVAFAIWRTGDISNDRSADNRSYSAFIQKSVLEGCARSNAFRAQLNGQSQTFLDHNRVTYELFDEIASRLPKDEPLRHHIEKAVADDITIAKRYRAFESVDCQRAYGGFKP